MKFTLWQKKPEPEKLLLDQLVDGGVAVLPVGPVDEQVLVKVTRRGDRLEREEICRCAFVKLIGQQGWGAE